MNRHSLSINFRGNLKIGSINVILVANAFVWYFLAFNLIRQLIAAFSISNSDELLVLGVNFLGIAVAAVVGSILIDTFKKRIRFLYLWTFAGIIVSLLPLALGATSTLSLFAISAIFGVYFGLGMPATMGYYASSTSFDNRSQIGGFIFLFAGLAFSFLGNIGAENIIIVCLILATVRIACLIILSLLKLEQPILKDAGQVKFLKVVTDRPFMLYFASWCMFSLVNYLTIPVMGNFFPEGGENFVRISSVMENILIAIFAVLSGFLASKFGRKRLTIFGFSMLGIGYAILGLAPRIMESWYFYLTVDGVAWGIFYTMFLFTLWGDLARDRNPEKYYLIGSLPYLFSNFIRLLLTPYVSEISATAIFSFASVFLFLAVLPLIYAPETLPEKLMKDRDLKSYVEKAQKKAKKESEKNPTSEKDNTETQAGPDKKDQEYEEAQKLAEKYY